MAANNEYVNRVDLGNETIIDLTNDTVTESDVLAGQTFHLRSGAPGTGTLNAVTEIRPGDNLGQFKASQLVGNDYNVDLPGFGTAYGLDIYDDTLPIQFTHPGGAIADGIVYGNNDIGKNKFPCATAETKTVGNLSVTCDGNGRYTINKNGALSEETVVTFDIPEFTVPVSVDQGGSGILALFNTQMPTGFQVWYYLDDTYITYVSLSTAANQVMTGYSALSGQRINKIGIRMTTTSDSTAVTGTLCTMVVNDGVTPEVYEPYQIGVGERTKNFIDLSVVSTETLTGVTFTVDRSAGTITVDGENTGGSDINYRIEGFSPPSPGNYYFSGCPVGGTTESYFIIPYDLATSALLRKWNGTTSTGNDYGTGPHEVLIKDTTILRFTIRIKAGYTADNVVFKPMLWLGSLGEDSPFIPYGYQIPLDLRQRSYNELDIRGYTETYFGVRWYEQDGILYANGTYNDNAAHSWPRLYLQLDAGTYVMSGSTDYQSTGIRVQIGTCSNAQGANFTSLGYDIGSGFTFTLNYPSWISVRMYTKVELYQQSIGLEFPLMIRKVDAPSEFRPYMWYYDHDERYIGETPLTAGQSRSFYDMGINLTAEPGTSYVDTTLYNKPRVEMVPYGGIYNVIKRIREDEVKKQNKPEIIWSGDVYKSDDGALFPDYIELDVESIDDYQFIEFDFRAMTNSGKTYSWATISLLNHDIQRWDSEFSSEDPFTDTNLQTATLCGLDGSGNVVYKNIAFQLQIDSYENIIYYKFMYESDSVFGDYTIRLRRIWGKTYES